MNNTKENLIRGFKSPTKDTTISTPGFIVLLVIVIVLGVVTGFAFRQKKTAVTSESSNEKGKTSVGIADKKTFKDKADGILKEGGMDGEGNFHLERPGGESQNVYLTSTTVDLSQFIGKKVRVWGQTFAGQKAAWLMDVGLVETL